MASEERQPGFWMGLYRAVTAIAALLVPFMFVGVMRVYDKLDNFGNRLTKIETVQDAMTKDEERQEKALSQVTRDVANLKEIYYTEVYPRFYGK